MTSPTRAAALQEITRLNALLSELLEQPGQEHRAQIWARLEVQLGPASRSADPRTAFPRETMR
jgi:hypothetical protein